IIRELAVGDVLDGPDHQVRLARRIPQERDARAAPDTRPVLAQIELLVNIAGALSADHATHLLLRRAQVRRMSDFDDGELAEFLQRVTEHAQHLLIGIDEAVAEIHHRDADGGVIERLPQALFAGAQRLELALERTGAFLRRCGAGEGWEAQGRLLQPRSWSQDYYVAVGTSPRACARAVRRYNLRIQSAGDVHGQSEEETRQPP